jgi:hypothetical protein
MIGRKNAEHGIGVLALNEKCSQAACGGRIAGTGLLNDLLDRYARQLLGDLLREVFFSAFTSGFRRSTVC